MVDSVTEALGTRGIEVWRDTADLRPGEDRRARTRQVISRDTRVFLAFLSRASHARARSHQREELTLAIEELRLRSPEEPWLIPVRLDDSPLPDWSIGAGRTLSGLQCVDLYGEDRDEQMSRLLCAVERAVESGYGPVAYPRLRADDRPRLAKGRDLRTDWEAHAAALMDEDVGGVVEVSADELRSSPYSRFLGRAGGLKLLPLNLLEAGDFDRLIAEMILSWGGPALRFFRRGPKGRLGLDITEYRPGGARTLYVVLRDSHARAAEIDSAVRAHAEALRERANERPERHYQAIIVVMPALIGDDRAANSALTDIKADYRGELDVKIWDGREISQRLKKLPLLVCDVFGESLAREYCGAANLQRAQDEAGRRARIDETLRLAAAGQYARYNEIRFRQVELSGISVDSLFVDVPVSSYAGSLAEGFLWHVNPARTQAHGLGGGDAPARSGRGAVRESQESGLAGAAQTLLHPDWSGSAVVVGGPGQGKTTLLQFLCQYYRARLLGRNEYSPIAAGLRPVSSVLRVPVGVELPEYAEWRRKHLGATLPPPGSAGEPHGANVTLESFMAHIVAIASTQSFTVDDLAFAVTSRSMLFALDGLDEIADADEREQVADEIRATRNRLSAARPDTQIVVATRPGSVGRPIWRDTDFSALFLNQLTTALRMKYLERWTAQSKLTPPEIDDVKKTFTKSITLPHVVELAGNPMQLAILLHLMQRRAVLPEKRTTLYERYIDVFMDREAKFAIVARNKDLIIAFHKLLAWHIHTGVELGKSKGTIEIGELKKLLTDYLIPRGRDVAFVDELFRSVTNRVLCLVQRDLESHEFQFEVQPLREYFAAEHLYDSLPGTTAQNTRTACLGFLLRYPYWSNVMRFFAGKLTSGEVPAMIYVLRDMQRDDQIGDHPLSRAAAKLLLDDQVLAGQVELAVMDMVHVILDGSGPVMALDGLLQQEASLLRFHPLGGAKQAAEVLLEAMTADRGDPVSAALLLCQMGESKEAARAWWGAIGATEPTRWWRTASALNALDNLRPSQETTLAGTLGSITRDISVLELLAGSHSDGPNDALAARCINELRDGHADVTGRPGANGPYQRLAAASDAGRFYEHARAAEGLTATQARGRSGSPPAPQPDSAAAPAQRLKSPSALWNSHVGALESAHSRFRRWDEAGVWHQLFDAAEEAWGGDCWPIREALLALPDFAHPVQTGSNGIRAGAAWRDVARWRAEAREHKADVKWWRGQTVKCVDPSAAGTYLTTALTTGSSVLVQELTGELNTLATGQDRADWIKLSAAVFRYSRYRRGRNDLNISDALRIRQIKPNGRLAVLIWHISRSATRSQLSRILADDLASLWNAGPAVRIVAQDLMRFYIPQISLDQVRGARSDLPEGILLAVKVKGMTHRTASEILRAPHQWPTDIVRSAADYQGRRLVKQVPIATLAARHDWEA